MAENTNNRDNTVPKGDEYNKKIDDSKDLHKEVCLNITTSQMNDKEHQEDNNMIDEVRKYGLTIQELGMKIAKEGKTIQMAGESIEKMGDFIHRYEIFIESLAEKDERDIFQFQQSIKQVKDKYEKLYSRIIVLYTDIILQNIETSIELEGFEKEELGIELITPQQKEKKFVRDLEKYLCFNEQLQPFAALSKLTKADKGKRNDLKRIFEEITSYKPNAFKIPDKFLKSFQEFYSINIANNNHDPIQLLRQSFVKSFPFASRKLWMIVMNMNNTCSQNHYAFLNLRKANK